MFYRKFDIKCQKKFELHSFNGNEIERRLSPCEIQRVKMCPNVQMTMIWVIGCQKMKVGN